MPDHRIRLAGTVQDVHGDDIEIGIVYDAAAGRDPCDGELPVIMIGHAIELGQDGAEEFARVFAAACREAARQSASDDGPFLITMNADPPKPPYGTPARAAWDAAHG